METGTSSTGTSSISSRPAAGGAGGRPKDRAARNAGIFLLLTAAVTVVMVLARVSSDTDQPTLAESLRAIADNTAIYSVAGTARLLSGLTLIIASWYLLRTWIVRERMVIAAGALAVCRVRPLHRRFGCLRPSAGGVPGARSYLRQRNPRGRDSGDRGSGTQHPVGRR